jgi:mono/diheme cytochrome c family protein
MHDRPLRGRRGNVQSALAALIWVIAAALTAALPVRQACADELSLRGAVQARIPDELELREQIEQALDLKRRDDFDRFLEARDPGELIEHATLTEVDFRHRKLDVDTLFVVGDELFGLLFRPENGWGAGGADRDAPDYKPVLRRVHHGYAGGPDAFGCFSCHSKGGPDGAGMQTQNAFLAGDGDRLSSADQRNPPHLLGLGPIALLAREVSSDLQAQAAATAAEAHTSGQPVVRELRSKGVSFGSISAGADGAIDYANLRGVDRDLIIRPFGWKGHQASLDDMIEESLHIHQGLVSMRIQQEVRDGNLDGSPYGLGERWFDLDDDGVTLEIDAGMAATVAGYLAQLEVPIIRIPDDPELLDAFAAGRVRFDEVGCAACHVPTLQLESPRFETQPVADLPPFVIDVAKDGEAPKIEPKYAAAKTPYLVRLFSDLKRHDMGEELASPARGAIPARVFLTRPLWGLAETAPYLHDGRAPTVHEAILRHGGEAAAARDAYLGLAESDRAALRVFLLSLSREPKLFIP